LEPVKDRIYAFDTIRTIMVLLGIVIHASILYNTNIFHISPFYSDPQSQSAGFNVLRDLIHVFRMPVFFSISGFFTALIFFERGLRNMISNRLHRLVYPFIAGLILLIPMHVFSLNFFAVSLSKLDSKHKLAWSAVRKMKLDEIHTAHLWFLYYLILYCVTVLIVAYCFERWFSGSQQMWRERFRKLFRSKAAPLVLAIPTLLSLSIMDTYDVDASHSFVPEFGFYLNYGFFFLFGWLCYGIKEEFGRFEKQMKSYLLIAFVLFALRWYCLFLYHDAADSSEVKQQLHALLIALLALNTWFFTFGIIGFFLKYFNKPSRISRYISDGSYWIYLIHMPIVIYFQSVLLAYDLPVFVKFSIVMLVTLMITVLSYNYLVRDTFVGKFLSGRKYPRGF
jgi:glucan biosynthesis protein C